MLLALVISTLHFILVERLDGKLLLVNPAQIVTLGEPKENSQVTSGVKCVITLSDGKFVSVRTSCVEIKESLEKLGR